MGIPLTLSQVPAQTPYIQYVSTNGQTVFPYPFSITQDSDLICVVNGVTQATDSGYTLSGQGNPTGGNLTFTLGRTTGDIITLYRNIAIQRISQIAQNSGFSSTVFNAEFNNIYLVMQQLQESIALSLQIPNTNNPAPVTTLVPANYAGKYLSFDSHGNPTPALLTSSGSLTQAIIAGLLQPQTPAEIAAGVVPANFAYSAPLGVDVRRYGVIGDGATDDTAAMTQAISTGLPLDISNLNIRITTRLTFNKNSQYVYARGGQFKYDGAATERLIQITANDVRFYGVKFNGNAKQVLACMIYCASNAARPKFLSCWFTNINGTHVGGVQNNSSNSQYAVMISPYGVEGFDFTDCIFDEIYNDNSGVNVAAVTGGGFCGGIFTLTDDFVSPSTPQGVPTSGQIGHCLFKNIKTILGAGLSIANQGNFTDAEGIRFYGDNSAPATETQLHVSIHDCVFYDCAKRAVKGSVARGVKVRNISVIATTALQYPMTTACKVDGDEFQLQGMTVYSPASAPIRQLIQTHDSSNIRVDGVFADRCEVVWSMAPTATTVVTAGWRVSNIRCNGIQPAFGTSIGYGFSSDTLPDHFEDCVFENITLEASSGLHSMLAGSFIANTNRMEVVLKNWRILGGDLKVAGYGFMLQDIYQEINDTAYVSSAAGRGLLEAGLNTGSGPVRDSIVHGYNLNIKAITVGYLSAGRLYFSVVYGDRTKVSQFRMWVPDAYDATFAHWQFDGSDYTIDDFEYTGQGYGYINNFSVSTKRRMTVDGARRIGGTGGTSPFFYLYLTEDCAVANIADYRLTTASSIVVQSGTITAGRTYAYILDGVWSLSSNTNVVTDGGALAKQNNVQKF